jgi:DNA-binding Lrp family transcriptional regulator
LQQPGAKEAHLSRNLPAEGRDEQLTAAHHAGTAGSRPSETALGQGEPASSQAEPREDGRQAAEPRKLDQIDRTILRVLRDDARVTMIELAERAGISRGSASTRFERLRRDGVIEGFTTRIAPRRVGLTAAAFVSLRVEQGAWRAVREALLAIPQVEQVNLVTGGSDFVVLVRAADVDSLRDLVLDRLRRVPGVRSTFTTVILDESTRGPALP